MTQFSTPPTGNVNTGSGHNSDTKHLIAPPCVPTTIKPDGATWTFLVFCLLMTSNTNRLFISPMYSRRPSTDVTPEEVKNSPSSTDDTDVAHVPLYCEMLYATVDRPELCVSWWSVVHGVSTDASSASAAARHAATTSTRIVRDIIIKVPRTHCSWRVGVMRLRTAMAVASVVVVATAWDVAHTPPMGWNSWNYWNCRVNATVLSDAAKAMVATGLSKVCPRSVCWRWCGGSHGNTPMLIH